MYSIEDIDVSLVKDGILEELDIEIKPETFEEDMTVLYGDVDEKVSYGYTAIIKLKKVFKKDNYKEEYYTSEVSIPENICEEDYQKIIEKIQTFDDKTIEDMTLINNTSRHDMDKDYDYYDYGQCKFVIHEDYTEEQKETFEKINAARRPNKLLDYFLRKKINKLSDYEKKMYEDYEEFNLEKLLFDDNMKYNPLSNDNCGVITIFPDKTYKSTVTKMQHMNEEKQHKKNYYGEKDNYVVIQVLKEEAIFYIPQSINEYQTNQINNFINEVEDLEKFNNRKVDIYGCIVEKSGELNILRECEGMEEVKDSLQKDVKVK